VAKFTILIFFLSFAAAASAAHADTQELALEKQCFSCHAFDRQVGKAPAFKAIAEKYRGRAGVEEDMVQKIKNGGVGHWGNVPMPSPEGRRPAVSEAEARELVRWILAMR